MYNPIFMLCHLINNNDNNSIVREVIVRTENRFIREVIKFINNIDILHYFTGMVGELYLRLLKMMIVPLIITSVLTSK